MYTISGKVVVKETGVGIPNLLVVVFDVISKTTSKKSSQIGKSTRNGNIRQNPKGNRIGSILTDTNGNFELSCDDKEFQMQGKERRPNLALSVMLPEETDTQLDSRILYVSPDIRQNAGRLETYLIQIPNDRIKKSGHFAPGIQMEIETVEMLPKIKELAENLKKKKSNEKMKIQQLERVPNSFDFTIPLRFTKKGLDSSKAMLSYDDKKGKILLKLNPEAKPVALTFRGVRYTQPEALEKIEYNISDFLIDPEKNEFHLRVPRSPNKLSLVEPMPTELYRHYAVQSRNAKSHKKAK